MGQPEALEKYFVEIEESYRQDLKWLSNRGIDTEGFDYKEVQETLYAECRKILLEEWGWYRVTSIKVANSYVRKNNKRRLYRAGRPRKRSYTHDPTIRYYDPQNKIIYSAMQAYIMAQEGIKRHEKTVGITELMTNALISNDIVLNNGDIVGFVWFSNREGEEPELGYVGKMDFDSFKADERYYTAQWLKEARKQWL